MFKKSVMAILGSLISAVLFGVSVFAAEKAMSPEIEEALAEVEEVNAEIYVEIAEAQEEAIDLYEEYLFESDEETDAEKRAELKAAYEKEVTALISKLDEKTQKMTRIGVEKATASGLTVEVVWVPVQFPDRVAMIDPIHVIDW